MKCGTRYGHNLGLMDSSKLHKMRNERPGMRGVLFVGWVDGWVVVVFIFADLDPKPATPEILFIWFNTPQCNLYSNEIFWCSHSSYSLFWDFCSQKSVRIGSNRGHFQKKFMCKKSLNVWYLILNTQDLHRNQIYKKNFQIEKSCFPCPECQKYVRNIFFR